MPDPHRAARLPAMACLVFGQLITMPLRAQTEAPTASSEISAPADAPVPAPALEQPASELLTAVWARYVAADHAGAAEIAEQGAQRFPNSALLHAMLGLSRMAMIDHAGAAAALERAVALQPQNPYYRLALARAYQHLERNEQARAMNATAIQLHEQGLGKTYAAHAEYLVWLGDAYGATTQAARRAYLSALEVSPKDPQARAALHRSFEHRTDSTEFVTPERKTLGGARGAMLVNPIAAAAGVITKVFTAGVELVFSSGANLGLAIYPQVAFTGEDNSFGVPGSAFGQALLFGPRVGFSGRYLDGFFLTPRFGPLHWGGDGWSFWALAVELEYGYTWSRQQSSKLDDAASAVGQVGLGLRLLLPTEDQLTLPALDEDWRTGATTVELKPMVGLLLDVSVGVGWF